MSNDTAGSVRALRTCARSACLSAAALLLAACGGGGGSSSGDEETAGRSAPVYTLGGTVQGLEEGHIDISNGLDMQQLNADPAGAGYLRRFSLNTRLPAGSQYDLLIRNDTLEQFGLQCEVSGGKGSVPAHAVDNIHIDCVRVNSVRQLAGTVSRPMRPGVIKGTPIAGSAMVWHAEAKLLYIADPGSHSIWKADVAHNSITVLAGSGGQSGYADGRGKGARFNGPSGIALDTRRQVLYVADSNNHVIRQVTLDGEVTLLAGQPRISGRTDCFRSNSLFNQPRGLAFHLGESADQDRLIVADQGNDAVRTIDPTPQAHSADTPCTPAQVKTLHPEFHLSRPHSVALAPGSRQVWVAEQKAIKQIDMDGPASRTLMSFNPVWDGDYGTVYYRDGTASCPFNTQSRCAAFRGFDGMAVGDDGAVYITDTQNNNIRVLKNGALTTFSGAALQGATRPLPSGYVNGPTSEASFSAPGALISDGEGGFFVLDAGNGAVRRVSKGVVSTYAGVQGDSASASSGLDGDISDPQCIAANHRTGEVFVADRARCAILRLSPDGSILQRVGSDLGRCAARDGAAPDASFEGPVAFDIDEQTGVLYVLDQVNGLRAFFNRLAKIDADGTVETIWETDLLGEVRGLAVASDGAAWVLADRQVRRIPPGCRKACQGEVVKPRSEPFERGRFQGLTWGDGKTNTIYLVDTTQQAVFVMDAKVPFASVATDESGRIYIARKDKPVIQMLSDDGKEWYDVAGMEGGDVPRLGAMPQPTGYARYLAFARKRLYFTTDHGALFIDR